MNIVDNLFEQNSEITEITDIIEKYKEIEKIYEETLIAIGEKKIKEPIFCNTNTVLLNKNIVSTKDF